MQETWVCPLGREDSPGEGKWQPTPVLLPGESHGGRSRPKQLLANFFLLGSLPLFLEDGKNLYQASF